MRGFTAIEIAVLFLMMAVLVALVLVLAPAPPAPQVHVHPEAKLDAEQFGREFARAVMAATKNAGWSAQFETKKAKCMARVLASSTFLNSFLRSGAIPVSEA